MEEIKWTEMNIYKDLLHMVETGEELTVPTEDFVAFCKRKIAVLENKKEKAKERAEKNKAATDEISDRVFEALSADKFETLAEITAKIGDEDITVSKVTYRLSKMVEAGTVEKCDVEVKGGKKSRTVKAYKKVTE